MSREISKEQTCTRVYGGEIEYGIRAQTEKEEEEYRATLSTLRQVGSVAAHAGLVHLGEYVENGSRLYLDQNKNIEYATPECTTLDDLVAAELAGEILVSRVFARLNGALIPHKRVDELDGDDSCGSHENYGTSLSIMEIKLERHLQPLAAHLATRTIYTGAGRYRNGTFNIAQKPFSLSSEELYNRGTTNIKPLVNTRNEPLSRSGMSRLHLICGDANISPWAIRMKFGTTSLVLRMLEAGTDLSRFGIKKPVSAAKYIAESPNNIYQPLEMIDGSCASALDIQMELAEEVAKFVETTEVPEDELSVLEDWIKVCQSFLRGINLDDALQQRIDWVKRKRVIDKKLSAGKSEAYARTLDLHYDQLGIDHIALEENRGSDDPVKSFRTGTGLGFQLRQRYVTDDEHGRTLQAMCVPPPTRARIRGRFVSTMRKKHPDIPAFANWNMLKIGEREVSIDPPHDPESINIDEVISQYVKYSRIAV